MAILWHEGVPSRSSAENPRSITLNYRLTGTNDDVFARAYAIACTAAMYDSLFRQDVKLTPIGESIWHIEVTYGPLKKPEVGDFKWAFDTGGHTAHITQSKESIFRKAAPGLQIEDHKGAIGKTDTCDVQGCDIVIPCFRWTEDWELNAESVSFAYAMILYTLTGSVNNAAFRDFAAGEVLFEGAAGSRSSKDPDIVQLSYHFRAEANAVNIKVGDIEGITKDGQDYMWIEYQMQKGLTRRIMPPIQINVERVYLRKDFSLLGIGVD